MFTLFTIKLTCYGPLQCIRITRSLTAFFSKSTVKMFVMRKKRNHFMTASQWMVRYGRLHSLMPFKKLRIAYLSLTLQFVINMRTLCYIQSGSVSDLTTICIRKVYKHVQVWLKSCSFLHHMEWLY